MNNSSDQGCVLGIRWRWYVFVQISNCWCLFGISPGPYLWNSEDCLLWINCLLANWSSTYRACTGEKGILVAAFSPLFTCLRTSHCVMLHLNLTSISYHTPVPLKELDDASEVGCKTALMVLLCAILVLQTNFSNILVGIAILESS